MAKGSKWLILSSRIMLQQQTWGTSVTTRDFIQISNFVCCVAVLIVCIVCSVCFAEILINEYSPLFLVSDVGPNLFPNGTRPLRHRVPPEHRRNFRHRTSHRH